MTITHGPRSDVQIPGGARANATSAALAAVFRTIRGWYLEAVQKRATAKLPAHLQLDIGELDQMPPTPPAFTQAEPSSYQGRLQQMWMR